MIPVVRTLPAPLSCTTRVLCVGFGTRYRLTALTVEPHATPTTMFESTYWVSIRAAERATR